MDVKANRLNAIFATALTGILRKSAMIALGTMILLMASAHAQETPRKKYYKTFTIAGSYNNAERSIELKVNTGCVSSSIRISGNDFRFKVDEEKALITATGGFIVKTPTPKIATADCMGRQQTVIRLTDVDARRYTLVMGGEYMGVLDFTKSDNPPRLGFMKQTGKIPQSLNRMRLANLYAAVNLDNWVPRRAISVMELFAPIISAHPESLEGRPEMEISLTRIDRFITVNITALGYLDDSVAGGKYAGIVSRKDGQWHLDSLWRQNLCTRGKNAGKWVKSSCP